MRRFAVFLVLSFVCFGALYSDFSRREIDPPVPDPGITVAKREAPSRARFVERVDRDLLAPLEARRRSLERGTPFRRFSRAAPSRWQESLGYAVSYRLREVEESIGDLTVVIENGVERSYPFRIEAGDERLAVLDGGEWRDAARWASEFHPETTRSTRH